jgi:protein-tyrosine phosphatase
MPLTQVEGDRIQEDHGVLTIITPPSPDNPRNFGPASSRDQIVYTCERPGGDPSDSEGRLDTQREVAGWVEFMSSRNIRNVVVLLGQDELDVYAEPGLIQAYKDAGVAVHYLPYSSPKSYTAIMSCLDDLYSKGEAVAAHCTHGMGRSGRIAAAWLVHKYGLGVDEATEEVLATAREWKVERMGSTHLLARWMALDDE